MNAEEKKALERDILELTDRFIEQTIQLGDQEKKDSNEYEKTLEGVRELIEKLSFYLSGKEEHLEELLRQLTRQKLPDQRVLTSFNNFSCTLNDLIEQGLALYKKNKMVILNQSPSDLTEKIDITPEPEPEQQVEEETDCSGTADTGSQPLLAADLGIVEEEGKDELESTVENSEETDTEETDTLEKILRQIFRGKTLVKNYKLHGIELKYYFPDLQLAVEKIQNATPHNTVWKEYHCSRAGITLVRISDEEMSYYRRVSRYLKRVLSPVNTSAAAE
ncbi:hypothetical protein [Zhaonella formicivorans]|uniref:hypothetical protein n=1 Tax=Zhaonella formicivorans TaxID=2528593 RepID=UPI0010CED27A|nr:hypothetical protein [Zhaonella formicivorans]